MFISFLIEVKRQFKAFKHITLAPFTFIKTLSKYQFPSHLITYQTNDHNILLLSDRNSLSNAM